LEYAPSSRLAIRPAALAIPIPIYFQNTLLSTGQPYSAATGTSGTADYITAARELSGKTVVAYIPQDGMTPTVAMNQLAGWSATAWWFNPRTGAGTTIGSYATAGTQPFTPPDTNDWVLVIDSILSNNAGAHP
ncbi:MAG: putative collagen-binding domain-containing protein, partial [Verrucomicrobiota bacterium]